MNGSVSKLYDIDSIAIPAGLLTLCVDEQQVEQGVRQLALRYASETPADAAQPGDVVRCRADAASYPDGRTILLFPGMALPGAEAAEQAVLGRGVDDEFSAPLCGRNAVLTVEGITRRTPVEVNDALIAGLGLEGVTTVAQYRAHLRSKALADLRMERSKEIIHYLMEQLEANSEFVYDPAEAEAYVQASAPEAAAAYAAEGVAFDPEEFRASMLSQLKQGWLAEAFCRSRGLVPDEAVLAADADQMLELAELTGEPMPGRAELLEMARVNACFNELFSYMDKLIAEKLGGSDGNC